MTKLQKNIQDFTLKCPGQTVRYKPGILSKEEAELRVRLVFEEAFELAEALGVEVIDEICQVLGHEFTFCQTKPQDTTLAADAMADLNYVVNGTAVALGVDMEPIDEEVHRSNMSKFIDGHLDAGGKWIKGPSYSPANIAALIKQQEESN